MKNIVSEQQVYQWLFEAVRARYRYAAVDTIHVSEVVGCLRKAYYMRTRAVTISPKAAVLLLGNSIHEALEKVLRRSGYRVEFQVSLTVNNFRLVGTIDAYHPDEEAVLELKTVDEIPQQPYRSHYMQTSIYSIIVSAKKSYLVYISRGDGKVKVFKVEPDKSALKWAVDRARTLRECLINRTPPSREKSILCNYCEFALMQCRVREGGSSGG